MAQCIFNKHGECIILMVELCRGQQCPWHKTKDEHYAGRRKAFKRLRRLSNRKQERIANKYYQGRKPWNKEEWR